MKWGLHVTGESPAPPPCAANTEGFGYTTRDRVHTRRVWVAGSEGSLDWHALDSFPMKP